MGVHNFENQAMLLPSTSVYNDLGYITEEDEEDDELLVSTTPKKSSSSKGRRRQSRGSYHKRNSLLSIDCTTVAVDDSIADDDDMNSPTHANISSSIKAKDTPHCVISCVKCIYLAHHLFPRHMLILRRTIRVVGLQTSQRMQPIKPLASRRMLPIKPPASQRMRPWRQR